VSLARPSRLVATDALWPFREHDGEVNLEDDPDYLDNLIEVVRLVGFTDAIVFNIMDDEAGGRRASVFDGNHHLVAARELGIDQLPLRIEHNLGSQHPGYPYHAEFD
jgi:hypothetical protein